jgi:hypothetical protein
MIYHGHMADRDIIAGARVKTLRNGRGESESQRERDETVRQSRVNWKDQREVRDRGHERATERDVEIQNDGLGWTHRDPGLDHEVTT